MRYRKLITAFWGARSEFPQAHHGTSQPISVDSSRDSCSLGPLGGRDMAYSAIDGAPRGISREARIVRRICKKGSRIGPVAFRFSRAPRRFRCAFLNSGRQYSRAYAHLHATGRMSG